MFSVRKCLFLLDVRLVVLCLAIIQTVTGFNLENRLPIIKYGTTDSYFGYSVAEHVIETESGKLEKW